MAYNSDGYIMIDFTEVDFRRTNQTIEGLYKRCVDVIGTNKFILVINANGRTPLPATCSFTNNQYVIDTCIYMFAISSNDNLFIRRNDVPASDIIDDSSISVDKTWSSNKIDSELDTKADTSALADYQPLLTAVSPISIDENDNISVDLSGKQDVLTAGDGISIVNNVISGTSVKTLTYTGNGTATNEITFPATPKVILSIQGEYVEDGWLFCDDIIWGFTKWGSQHQKVATQNVGGSVSEWNFKTEYDGNKLIITGSNANNALNSNGAIFTVCYI